MMMWVSRVTTSCIPLQVQNQVILSEQTGSIELVADDDVDLLLSIDLHIMQTDTVGNLLLISVKIDFKTYTAVWLFPNCQLAKPQN